MKACLIRPGNKLSFSEDNTICIVSFVVLGLPQAQLVCWHTLLCASKLACGKFDKFILLIMDSTVVSQILFAISNLDSDESMT